MGLHSPSDALSDLAAHSKRREGYDVARAARRVQIAIPVSGNPIKFGQARAAVPYLGIFRAVVRTAIGPATVSGSVITPGLGYMQLYYFENDGDSSVTGDPDSSATPVLNIYKNSGTIPVGTQITVGAGSGVWWLVGADC